MMKCVPIFFLVGLCLVHLVNVLAIPNAKRRELERLEIRKAAAISRFNISKRNAPFKSPWKKRSPVAIKLRKYKNYLRAVTKKYFRSAKARVETQMTDLRETLLDTLGRDMIILRSFQTPIIGEKWEAPAESDFGMKERYQTLSESTIDEEAGGSAHRHSTQITTSVYEMFLQVTQELLLRVQSFRTDSDVDSDFNSLKATQLSSRAKIEAQILRENMRKQAEKDELLSKTFVPQPSGVPSLEPTPGTNPEPSIRESVSNVVKDHSLEYSATPTPAGLGLHGVPTVSGSVLTFRRLARFAARI